MGYILHPQLQAYAHASGSDHLKNGTLILPLLKIEEHCENGKLSAFRLSQNLLCVLISVWLIYQKYKMYPAYKC